MKLILAGGGDAKQSEFVDRLFVSFVPKGKKVIYIPIALQSKSSDECYKWFHSVFYPLGLTNIDMWDDVRNRNRDLKKAGAIYIGGGNTYYLLHKFREAGFDQLLKRFILDGGIVYGGSAGAIILGKDITVSQDKNKVNLRDTKGLALINGFSVWPHYKEEDDEKIWTYISQHKDFVIAIPEDAGVLLEDSKIMAIGDRRVFTFDMRKKRLIETQ